MAAPEMSVVMIDLHGEVGASLRALLVQGPSEQVEVVLVAPDARAAEAAYPELASFGASTIVETPRDSSTSTALAAGFRATRGRVVAYCEDHVVPEPGWVEARLAAHDRGAAAVGGTLRNGNPGTAASWASYLQSFGPFAMPVAGGQSANLPWHQCSYDRNALPFGPELEPLLENEALLHSDLSKAGKILVVESAAVAAHVNPSRLRSVLMHAWLGGRVWGAGRARHARWSPARRLIATLLFPRTALGQLRLGLADVRRVAPPRSRAVAMLLAVGTVIHAAGEAAGILFGDAGATARRTDLELNRHAHLIPRDRARS